MGIDVARLLASIPARGCNSGISLWWQRQHLIMHHEGNVTSTTQRWSAQRHSHHQQHCSSANGMMLAGACALDPICMQPAPDCLSACVLASSAPKVRCGGGSAPAASGTLNRCWKMTPTDRSSVSCTPPCSRARTATVGGDGAANPPPAAGTACGRPWLSDGLPYTAAASEQLASCTRTATPQPCTALCSGLPSRVASRMPSPERQPHL